MQNSDGNVIAVREVLFNGREAFDGILNYCDIKLPLGFVENLNGKIKTLLRRTRGFIMSDILLSSHTLTFTEIQFSKWFPHLNQNIFKYANRFNP